MVVLSGDRLFQLDFSHPEASLGTHHVALSIDELPEPPLHIVNAEDEECDRKGILASRLGSGEGDPDEHAHHHGHGHNDAEINSQHPRRETKENVGPIGPIEVAVDFSKVTSHSVKDADLD